MIIDASTVFSQVSDISKRGLTTTTRRRMYLRRLYTQQLRLPDSHDSTPPQADEPYALEDAEYMSHI